MNSKPVALKCLHMILPGLLGIMLTGCAGTKPEASCLVKKPGWQETVRLSLIRIDQLEQQHRSSYRQHLKELGIKPGPWYTIGPFSSPNKTPFEAVFGPEKEVDLQKTYDNGRLKWEKREDWKDGVIHKLSGDAGPGEGLVVADYMYREIEAEKPVELPMYFGSNDGIQVWFNGKRVLAYNFGRTADPDQDVVKVNFKQGTNRLLIKVDNHAAGHAFYFSFQRGGGIKKKMKKKLWKFVKEEFSDKTARRHIEWEKEDGIWDDLSRPGNLKSLAQRYAEATRNIGKLPEKARKLSVQVENLSELQQVRDLYYTSRKFGDTISGVENKVDLVKHQYRQLRTTGGYTRDNKNRRAYQKKFSQLLMERTKHIRKVRKADKAAINALEDIENKLDQLYISALPHTGEPKEVPACKPFELNRVKLLESPFRAAMYRDRKYLYMLDSDRLLHMFRVTAGLPSSASPLGGWEQRKLRGHTMGHYLSACAMMYASTGDEQLKKKADRIIAELAECQEALGNGYLGAFPEEGLKKVIYGTGRWWAPWYTYHKIMAGMIDMYHYCHNRQALQIAEGMADWAKMHLDNINEKQTQEMLEVEFGGMNEVLCNLYEITGNPDHLALARRFDHKKVFEPLADFKDKLKGLHVNTQIPKVIGAAREYELTGESYYYNIATYFWDEVTGARTYCTGGTSNHEHWRTEPYKLASELSPVTQESCTTYNMLKLTRELFTWEPDAYYGDYYERALYNGILPTQDPATGMMMYFVPLESGYWKIFNTPFDSFWCCTGTGMENHAKYANSIYFRDEDGIYVNLFIPSEVNWVEKGIKISQQTNFPEEQGTTLLLKGGSAGQFAIRIRIPYWVSGRVTIRVNGEKQNPQEISGEPRSFVSLKRKWKAGDRIEVSLPMKLHLCPLPEDRNIAAVMYGPLVLAGKLGKEGMDPQTVYSDSQGVLRNLKVPKAPRFTADRNKLESWIKPVKGRPLTFRTVNAGSPRDVRLVPLYELFGERYGVYWHIKHKSSSSKSSGCPCRNR